MAKQLLLNFIIAFTLMFLTNGWDVSTFILGYLLGMLLLFGMRRFFSNQFYMKNVLAILKLLYIFLRELIKSNIEVVKVVLSPRLKNNPGIFALPTELKKDWEVTILANLITLTPGTLVLAVSDDNKTLYVHAMDLSTTEDAIMSIKNTFEKAILEVSR